MLGGKQFSVWVSDAKIESLLARESESEERERNNLTCDSITAGKGQPKTNRMKMHAFSPGHSRGRSPHSRACFLAAVCVLGRQGEVQLESDYGPNKVHSATVRVVVWPEIKRGVISRERGAGTP